jgi:GT2 family glycosyltransferase
MKPVSVILLNCNNTPDTLECLASLRGLDYPAVDVVVVENGSREPCTPVVRERFPEARVLESPVNLGFTGGNNLGIADALRRGAAYVWVLNNDTVVEPGSLSALVAVAEGDPRIGVAGSKIRFYQQRDVIDYAGGYVDAWRGHAGHVGLGELDRGQYDRVRDVDFVTGCSFLARREMVEQVGAFDEALFIYWEDVDWCARARAAGWRVVYAPGSLIFHKGGQPAVGGAAANVSASRLYLCARNSLRYMGRYHPARLPVAMLWWMRDWVLGPAAQGRFAHVPLGVAALRDWARGRGGPRA